MPSGGITKLLHTIPLNEDDYEHFTHQFFTEEEFLSTSDMVLEISKNDNLEKTIQIISLLSACKHLKSLNLTIVLNNNTDIITHLIKNVRKISTTITTLSLYFKIDSDIEVNHDLLYSITQYFTSLTSLTLSFKRLSSETNLNNYQSIFKNMAQCLNRVPAKQPISLLELMFIDLDFNDNPLCIEEQQLLDTIYKYKFITHFTLLNVESFSPQFSAALATFVSTHQHLRNIAFTSYWGESNELFMILPKYLANKNLQNISFDNHSESYDEGLIYDAENKYNKKQLIHLIKNHCQLRTISLNLLIQDDVNSSKIAQHILKNIFFPLLKNNLLENLTSNFKEILHITDKASTYVEQINRLLEKNYSLKEVNHLPLFKASHFLPLYTSLNFKSITERNKTNYTSIERYSPKHENYLLHNFLKQPIKNLISFQKPFFFYMMHAFLKPYNPDNNQFSMNYLHACLNQLLRMMPCSRSSNFGITIGTYLTFNDFINISNVTGGFFYRAKRELEHTVATNDVKQSLFVDRSQDGLLPVVRNDGKK